MKEDRGKFLYASEKRVTKKARNVMYKASIIVVPTLGHLPERRESNEKDVFCIR
jgi:hypothetical protein